MFRSACARTHPVLRLPIKAYSGPGAYHVFAGESMKADWCALILALSCIPFITGVSGAQESNVRQLAQKAQDILRTSCYRCHGQDGANEGGFNYAADLRLLVSRKRVTPGESTKSKLIKRITNVADPMPPAEEKVRPTAE